MATRGSKIRSKPKNQINNSDLVPDFPNEWISIAAYYIWKNEGEPEGKDLHYWEKAKAELQRSGEKALLLASIKDFQC